MLYEEIRRRFINGSCRFGSRCNYLHEWPVIPSSQICRYYQKGGCWYGERCRFFHVLQPEADTAVAGRRASVPTVSSSSVAHMPPDRRGSEPALLQAEVTSRQECSRSELLDDVSNPQRNTGHLPANIVEEQSEETGSELARSSEVAEAGACDGRNEEISPPETPEDGAAASGSQGKEETESFLRSKDVTCGICMEKVYEKTDLKSQVFGILPNCNHSFCLHCIMTWRKTKDLSLDVIKRCPQCRVRSAFYVPHKYWVEGQAKEDLIAEFKEKFSKKCCGYYTRYRCCPFKTDCLYRHDKTPHGASFLPCEEDDYEDDDDGVDLLRFFIAMTLHGDGEDDLEFTFLPY
ncbi:makorin, ring finger protein, 4 isoform X2 [Archocentrus centrarchus]|uniref:makorin, ring finger protein, 4 isoform X2 n=1 Tax=Archocentrus centrarchus TaxID=63155 RepID=UPI0011EA104F|nr:E3 ubiquitin-protein ligase makorin-1-like isoform X2 [Archocentrus centrarchus]